MNVKMVESASIRPIEKNIVNKICSGQVVLNLATAVKELLENSIDAGSTAVQIKLEEYGSESIEVIDDGHGVEEVNFQALTLKHHTSKISEFNDLFDVRTFGFRGEALSSLCGLSDVTITTKHKNAVIGASLKFNHQGIITSNVKTLRKNGTTVRLENLFCTLPIRRIEFLKNLKREFSKMCNVLYAYGLQTTGVRITCTNRVSKIKSSNKETQGDADAVKKKGAPTTIMDTKGDSIESNIRSIFGLKQNQNLLKVVQRLPGEDILSEFGLKNIHLDSEKFKLEGYISSCAHGCGRSSSDRQFYYINSRPIDNPKISKLVNEVYHGFNGHQDPFVILNVKVSVGSIDVNVTPDKRQILVQNEKILLAVLKASLLDVFQSIPFTMEVKNIGIAKNKLDLEKTTEWSEKFKNLKSNSRNASSEIREKKETGSINNWLRFQVKSKNSKDLCTNDLIKETHSSSNLSQASTSSVKSEDNETVTPLDHAKIDTSSQFEIYHFGINDPLFSPDKKLEIPPETERDKSTEMEIKKFANQSQVKPAEGNGDFKRKLEAIPFEFVENPSNDQSPTSETEFKRMKFDEGLTEKWKISRNCMILDVDLDRLKEMILSRKNVEKNFKREKVQLNFLAEIKPQNNEKAEAELKRVIEKKSFSQMEIIGQFNLGFIITKLNSDVFIIDQHASDEKYNFESIRSNTVMQTQKLINPEKLELTVDKEELMLFHREVFTKNGFEFVFDEAGIPTKRIQLTSIPLSKNVVFGKDEVEELLFLLEDAPEKTIVRPSRVQSMFASRACRKSVMIGTPLNRMEMRKIVNHMGEIEQPWNCPHGRPTMRHLVNLQMICLEN